MSDRRDRSSSSYSHNDSRSRRGFSAPQSDHIRERNGANRYTPYGNRPSQQSHNRASSPDSQRQENVNYSSSSSNSLPKDDTYREEHVYHVPTQKYTDFEAKSNPQKVAEDKAPKKKMTVAAVFNCDSSEDEEEIPIQAKMRMRNVGKNTPTSSGPNSFGKTKRGFTDTVKMWEKDPVKVAQFIVEKRKEGDTDAKKN